MPSNPFLAGQRLTAGQLNDATEKTLDSVEVGTGGIIAVTSGTTELDIPALASNPIDLVAGGLYAVETRLTVQNSVATDEYNVRIRRDTALTGTIVIDFNIYSQPNTAGHLFVAWGDFISATTSPGTLFFVSLRRVNGSGTLSLYGQLSTTNRTGNKFMRTGYSDKYRIVT